MQILLVEDNANKALKISTVLDSIANCKYETAPDATTARRLLIRSFDLMIIDMNLPERFNEVPKESKGIEFIQELKASQRLKFPTHIIGLTEFENLFEKYQSAFSEQALVLIKYDIKGMQWQSILREQISRIEKALMEDEDSGKFKADIAFIAALRTPELSALLSKNYNWIKFKLTDDPSIYFKGEIVLEDKRKITVVATSLPQMGMVSTATTTTKVISAFSPDYVIMVGICGGIKGKVTLGDVVVADLSFDFGSGKVIKDDNEQEKFEPDFKAIPLDGDFKEEIIELSTQKKMLREIKDGWKGNEVDGEINLVVGPIGSGASVIANKEYTDKILTHQRKLVAIDMETYSIFYCCEYANSPKPKALSIKGVCDYADHEKNDNIQKYCSYVSVETAEYIIKNILKFNAP